MKPKFLKHEIAQAALSGIQAYLNTTRGAQFFRDGAAILVPGTNAVQVQYKVDGQSGPHFIEVNVKGNL